MPIHVLSDQVIAQIAAGEVVERPASVVKELVENALDAGATTIHVSAKSGGQRMIRISDNGTGIHSDEVELAFARHATSKLRSAAEIESITTLGFRGEALSSIASVSQVTVTTRHHSEESGTRLRIEGGELITRKAVGAPAGSIITIENLFFNTPARLKFMKKEATERRHLSNVVTHYAMAYPEVRFILENDEREVFRSSGSGQLADVIVKVLGLDNFKRMIAIDGQHGQIAVSGFSSTPDLYRSDRSRIMLFVNGRHIQDSSLSYSVVQAYHNFMESGRYPVAVLMIEVPGPDVDVNVHPTKAEVRFRDANQVFSAVQRILRERLIAARSGLDLRSRAHDDAPVQPKSAWETTAGFDESQQLNLETDDTPAPPAGGRRRHDYAHDPTAIPVGPGAPTKPRTLPVLRVVGQVGATYIVAEGPAGLYLVDQHAAHHRVLYEQFKGQLSAQDAASQQSQHTQQTQQTQQTMEARTLTLDRQAASWLEDHLDALGLLGFQVESFGPNTFAIRGVPLALAHLNPVDVISRLAQDLSQGKKGDESDHDDLILQRLSQYAAVKSGQVLNTEEMQGLIRQLERCPAPHTSPDGRSTMLHMSGDQIAREFER